MTVVCVGNAAVARRYENLRFVRVPVFERLWCYEVGAKHQIVLSTACIPIVGLDDVWSHVR